MSETLEIRHLTKTFRKDFWGKKVTVVNDVSLSVHGNEIFGFVGPNGCGKTTTIKICLGLLFPTRGTVSLLGESAQSLAPKKRIGYLPENPVFYDYLTGREFLDFYGQLYGMPAPARRARADDVLELVHMTDAADVQLRKYSKGMLQRIGLAQALLSDPDLVILDEPMSGLDPIGRQDVRNIILSLKEAGKTVFFSTHILSDVEVICDRVGIMNNGRLLDTGVLTDIITAAVQTVDIRVQNVSVEQARALPAVTVRPVPQEDVLLLTAESTEAAQEAMRAVHNAGGDVIAVTPQRESLEAWFLREVEGR